MLLGRDYLKIYLEDHYAASTAGLELARRTAGANAGNAYGEPLRRLVEEIEEDRDTLHAIMSELGVGPDRVKNAGAWAGEKLGRLKLNGHVTGYSPYSRVLELEGLVVGITGKLALWRGLREVASQLQQLSVEELDRLAARAERQRTELQELALVALAEAVAAADRG